MAEAHAIPLSRYQIYSADVSEIDSIVKAGQACIILQVLPDVVIANAGIGIGMDTAVREDLEVMTRTLATNTVGVAATLPPLWRAYVACRDTAAPTALAKAAVISYCESLRGELRHSGVKVVTICPGYIDTPLTQKNRYAMPFWMKAGGFADKAFDSIEAGHRYRVIPW